MARAKEKPIQPGPAIIEALAAGRKTQLRLPIRPHPCHQLYPRVNRMGNTVWAERFGPDCGGIPRYGVMQNRRPPYPVGTSLWVKEQLYYTGDLDVPETVVFDYAIGCTNPTLTRRVRKTLPARSMPRWAARFILRVTDVQVARLQDITEKQASYEGAYEWATHKLASSQGLDKWCHRSVVIHQQAGLGTPDTATVRGAFSLYWDARYRDSEQWQANPWVWVHTLEMVSNPRRLKVPPKAVDLSQIGGGQ